MRLILARHGETTWNEGRRYQGWEDPPLSNLGRATAARVGALLRIRTELDGFAVWSSDLRRAEETARIATGRAPRVDRRLRELDFGAFAGRTYEENVERFGTGFTGWIAAAGRSAPPGGETAASLLSRAGAWLEEVRATTAADGAVLAVTHGGVIRVLVEELTGAACRPGHEDVTVLRWAGGARPDLERWTLDHLLEDAR